MNYLNKKVSIIVPIYNAEKYLSRCLDSLINQTYSNIEIICVNDGSTDDSLKIIEDYSKKFNKIIIINQKNQGVSKARNVALQNVTGEYVMFIDSDDWIELETCEKAVAIMEEKSVDLVFWTYLKEFGETSSKKFMYDEDEMFFSKEDVKQKLQRRVFGVYKDELAHPEGVDMLTPVWGKLFKTSAIKLANYEFVDLKKVGSCEDGLFNIEVFAYVESAYFINQTLYHYWKGNDLSETTKYRSELYDQWQNLFGYMQNYIDGHKCGKEYQITLYNRICISILQLGLNIMQSDLKTSKKIKEFNKILNNPTYIEAYKYLEFKYLPIYWKVYFMLAKMRFGFGVFCFTKLINKLRG